MKEEYELVPINFYIGPKDLLTWCPFSGAQTFWRGICRLFCPGKINGNCPFTDNDLIKKQYWKYFELPASYKEIARKANYSGRERR